MFYSREGERVKEAGRVWRRRQGEDEGRAGLCLRRESNNTRPGEKGEEKIIKYPARREG